MLTYKLKFCELFAYLNYIPMLQRNQEILLPYQIGTVYLKYR